MSSSPLPRTRAHWLRPENAAHPAGPGTVGAILRSLTQPQQLYALTAGHVLGGGAQAQPGDPVTLTLYGRDRCMLARGSAVRWEPRFDTPRDHWRLDAGLVQLDAGCLDGALDEIAWPTSWADPQADTSLRLLTRQHRIPAQVVAPLPWTEVSAGLPAQRYVLKDSWCVRVDDASQPAGRHGSVAGDSGAAFWDAQDRLVAINIGAVELDGGTLAVAVPIRRILEWAACTPVLRGEPLQADGRSVLAGIVPTPQAMAGGSVTGQTAANAEAIEALARTMWGEARGEPDADAGLRAVAHVVLNRRDAPGWWGHTVVQVCRHAAQFSCWNEGDPNLPQLLKVTESDPVFALARRIAAELLTLDRDARRSADTTHCATHYHAANIRTPYWARGREPLCRIGNHLFYRDIG